MATQSILKSICISDKEHSHKLISALEKAASNNGKDVDFSCDCKRIGHDEVKAFFNDKMSATLDS